MEPPYRAGADCELLGQSSRWRHMARTAGIDPLPDAWEKIEPNGGIDLCLSMGSDSYRPDEVIMFEVGPKMIKLPVTGILRWTGARPRLSMAFGGLRRGRAIVCSRVSDGKLGWL